MRKESGERSQAGTRQQVRVVPVRRKELDAHKLALACLLMSRRLHEETDSKDNTGE